MQPHALKILILAGAALMPAIASANTRLPEGFLHLETAAPSIRQDMRYYGKENFLGARVDGYHAPRCILTKPAAEALARAQAELQPQGLSLKVFDCYRPQRAVLHFMRWALLPDDPRLRDRYHPHLNKSQLLQQVYIADKSGHSRGSTVDLTIVSAKGGTRVTGHDGCSATAARRGGSLDMGSGFDCFDPLSNTADPSITAEQRANRQLLKAVMKRAGFYNYEREWWHYILNHEPFPETYFDFPVH
ncbi:MAG: M15 family metallopeptidase [Nevskiales bacterium]